MSEYIYYIIAAVIICVVVCAVLLVRNRIRSTEYKNYYDAAARMIKENMLDEIIQTRDRCSQPSGKVMLCIRIAGKKKQGFVFDPVKGIRIGRDPQRNEVCIRDIRVSGSHCSIYIQNGRIVLQDFHSSNGTWIRRGLRRHRASGTEEIRSGDRVQVGDTTMEITLFVFDMMDL